MTMKLVVVLLLAASASMVTGARILAVFPIPAKSHHILFNAVLRTLAEAGHEVVCYSGLPADTQVANLTVNHLTSVAPTGQTMTKEMLYSMLSMSPVGAASILWRNEDRFLDDITKDTQFLQLVNSKEKFDLVLIEAFFTQEALFAFGHKFNAPVINLQPFGSFSLVSSAHGNPLNLAFIPDFAFPYSDRMSFYQRALNAYSILSSLYKYYAYQIDVQDRYMKKIFNDPSLPHLSEVMLNRLTLTFSNAHPYVHYSQPYAPNIIPIGGIHLAKETKPLPSDMKKFLDGASEGVIYFSMGSIVPDHLLDDEYFNNFLTVFGRLPQRVLWKTKRDLKNVPSNVMTSNWVPQQDVLAHPNMKVFMTHGGVFSQHEAIHAGVPVVCTPYFGDQPLNARFYEEKEIGLILPFKSLSEETIQSALTEVLRDPKYRDNMARMSRIYRDRPISPAETLVFWVEYTLRHGGAPHLRPASASMPFYQLYLLDVVGALLLALFLTVFLLYVTIKKILGIFITKSDNVKSNKSKKEN